MTASNAVRRVLQFWFNATPSQAGSIQPEAAVIQQQYQRWFKNDPAFDEECKDLAQPLLEQLDEQPEFETSMKQQEHGNVALILLYDQFPRNIFRNQAKAFSYDTRAQSITMQMIASREVDRYSSPWRTFILMPLQHSESIEHQCLSLEENANTSEMVLKFAQDHFKVIERFGRFPHRNEVLNRVSTPEEKEYLAADLPIWAKKTNKDETN